ncbi:MAG: Carbamoyl-phosphate synthase large chain [candidate division WS2 bacterium]|uniref:Carbamoyl-phosphate synthase large chain n=1 Tax=Psychracetigena formicireducens TaxID=2986056 RepID=A0A9E2BK98_PSYF1|nr:Carbamoyl-phosphate synthase large chain [Candidatus Psychracetigena formicireducens]
MGCIGEDYYEAVLKSMLSVGYKITVKNVLMSTGPSKSKIELLTASRLLVENGCRLFGTKGTQQFFHDHGIPCTMLYWPDENQNPNTLNYIKEKKIDLVINIPKNLSKDELFNDYLIRRSAIDFNIPLITNARLANAFIHALCNKGLEGIKIKSWDEYEPT